MNNTVLRMKQIFDVFEQWMDERNSKIHEVLWLYKGYLSPDETFGKLRDGQDKLPHQHIPYIIQQVEYEIKGLVLALLKNLKHFNKCLEIGMGDYGGTHTIFKQIFNEVHTIEWEKETTHRYIYLNQQGTCPINNQDKFYIGDSTDKNIIKTVEQQAPFDFLFIDGDHLYPGCRADYDNYFPVVKKGGIIAFHDTHSDNFGVARLVKEIKQEFGYDIINLHYSKEIGISYFIKP